MRMTWDEAIQRDLVSETDRPDNGDGHQVRVAVPRRTASPQEVLWYAIEEKWPGQACWELEGAVEGRKFRIDIAFPTGMVAIEYDGIRPHSFGHGKGKNPDGSSMSAVEADREKDLVLREHGWTVLRYSRAQINFAIDRVLADIERAITTE